MFLVTFYGDDDFVAYVGLYSTLVLANAAAVRYLADKTPAERKYSVENNFEFETFKVDEDCTYEVIPTEEAK
jgi:hypothetical protein